MLAYPISLIGNLDFVVVLLLYVYRISFSLNSRVGIVLGSRDIVDRGSVMLPIDMTGVDDSLMDLVDVITSVVYSLLLCG